MQINSTVQESCVLQLVDIFDLRLKTKAFQRRNGHNSSFSEILAKTINLPPLVVLLLEQLFLDQEKGGSVMGIPPSHPFIDRIFPYEPSSCAGPPMTMETGRATALELKVMSIEKGHRLSMFTHLRDDQPAQCENGLCIFVYMYEIL